MQSQKTIVYRNHESFFRKVSVPPNPIAINSCKKSTKLASSEKNQPLATSGHETADVLLNGFKLGVATTLALEVIEECGQS